MKVYKSRYNSPKIELLPLEGPDILTSSAGADEGTETPVIDEGGVWKEGR